MADTITKNYVGTAILQRESPMLGRDAVQFALEDTRLNNLIDDLQRQINTQASVVITNPLLSGHILVGNAANVATDVAMSGEASITNTGSVTLLNSAVIGKVLTGFVVGANTPIVAADTILGAFQKTQGQINALIAGTSPLTTKGDIFTYAAANARLGIGANATIFMADSAAATGNKWIALSGDATIATTGVVTVAAYKTVEDEGVPLTQRTTINFAGAGVTATDSGGKTLVTIPGGGGTPTLTATQIAFGDGANLMTSSANFTYTAPKVTITPDGTGALGGLYITRGDSVNQYIVLHENVASPNSAYLTFKSSGGNAVGQGVIFAAGAPVSYVFTDPSGVPLNTIDVTTGLNTIGNLAGVGTRMVTANATGDLIAAAIPTNTTIVNDPNWTLLGQLVYGTGASTGAILNGHTNADRRFLSQTGTGAVSAAPAWVRFDAADILTGVLGANFGGTGVSNNIASTLTISGVFATTLTVTATTGVTLPDSGTLYGTKSGSITSSQLATSLTDEIGTGAAVFASANIYTMNGNTFFSTSSDPADGATYYIGSRQGLYLTQITTGGINRIYIPKAGTIVYGRITYFQNAGTGETSTINIRLNNTSDTVLSATVTNDATVTSFSNTGLAITVVEGDYVELKWVAPAWATNPTDVSAAWVIGIQPT